MQPLFAYNALIWKNTITILTLILFVVFLVRGLYLFAVLGKHLLKSNQGFQYQQQARDIRNSFSEKMAKEGFYLVKSVLRHRYRQGWRFLTLWEGFGVEEATWEPFSEFVLPEGRLNSVLVDYLSQNNLGELLRLAETLASKTKARD